MTENLDQKSRPSLKIGSSLSASSHDGTTTNQRPNGATALHTPHDLCPRGYFPPNFGHRARYAGRSGSKDDARWIVRSGSYLLQPPDARRSRIEGRDGELFSSIHSYASRSTRRHFHTVWECVTMPSTTGATGGRRGRFSRFRLAGIAYSLIRRSITPRIATPRSSVVIPLRSHSRNRSKSPSNLHRTSTNSSPIDFAPLAQHQTASRTSR